MYLCRNFYTRNMTFEDLGVSPNILKSITELGFETPTPVQTEVLPILLQEDTDLITLAQTGTGKTAAFGIPVIQKLDTGNSRTEVLILCPTRELCLQITKDCKNYSKYVPHVSVTAIYGGAGIGMQAKEIERGSKIIVGTPGRMKDMIRRGIIDLSHVKYLVLDEADEMLDMGFKDDLDDIISQIPDNRHTLLFSATMPYEVESIAQNYMVDPKRVQIGSRNEGARNVKHYYYLVYAKDRYLALKRIADYYPDIYCIVFCRTKVETQEVADKLIKDGYNADALHGDLSQPQRDHVMNRFRCKNIQMLVATDVAARGLDVNNLTHVINYNLPDELEQYVHRSGRTGRADKDGISIAIINFKERGKIKLLEKQLNKEFSRATVPTREEVCKKQLFHLINRVENVDVNYSEIEEFLPEIFKKLEWMDREELIRKFVSVEFNHFLEYYRDAPDLNVDVSKAKQEEQQSRKPRMDKDGDFTRLFLNIGRKDRIVPQRIIGMINDFTRRRNIAIGRIDIFDTFSYVDVDADAADLVIDALSRAHVRGRQVRADYADNKPDKNSRGRASRHREDNHRDRFSKNKRR